jgi:hypothetical protein
MSISPAREPELFSVSSQRSKDKLSAFFGEQSIPIHVGHGSSLKLKNFFVTRSPATAPKKKEPTSPRSPEAEVVMIKTQSSGSTNSNLLETTGVSPKAASRRYSMPNRSTAKIQKVMGSSCPVDVSMLEVSYK